MSTEATSKTGGEAERPPAGKPIVAVVGATGYLGGRLVRELLARGHPVRAIARSIEKLRCRTDFASADLEPAAADAADPAQLRKALEGCEAAYYLVRSALRNPAAAAARDARAAANMVRTTELARVKRIIYLSNAWSETGAKQSPHLRSRSRARIGSILAKGPVPLTWLRTAPILGSGGALFEIVRHLAERLPVIVAPRWMRSAVRPIAVQDVVGYLADCLENPATVGLNIEILGPDRVTLSEILAGYAAEAGLPKRLIVPMPFHFIELSAYGINHLTPLPAHLARLSLEDMLASAAAKPGRGSDILAVQPTHLRTTLRIALRKVRQQRVETCWSDAGEMNAPEWLACDGSAASARGIFECNYRGVLDCPPEAVWQVIRSVGGGTGWFFGDILWRMRGFVDRLLGGVGTSRGRRHSEELRAGDALDFWRVLLVEENRRLILLAEMLVPGEAVLSFTLEPLPGGGCELAQIARFRPKGLFGLAYWYAMAPFHDFLFQGMFTGIAGKAACAVRRGPEKFTGGGNICRLPAHWGQNA